MEDAIFSLRPSEKLQLANAKASWKRTRSDPLTNIPACKPRLMSGVIYWHYLEHGLVAVLIGPTILRLRQRHCPETDAIFDLGGGLSTILHFLLEALWKLVDLVHPTCPFDPSFFSNSSLVPLTARLPLRIPILLPFTRKRYTKKPCYFEVEITF